MDIGCEELSTSARRTFALNSENYTKHKLFLKADPLTYIE